METPNVTPTETPSLSKTDIVRAWTNSPSLATDHVMIGSEKFSIIDLDYDSYVEFLALFEPLVKTLFGGFMNSDDDDINIPGIDLDSIMKLGQSGLMKYCKNELPEMARIVCAQTKPEVTVEWVKKNVRSPLKMTEIVMKQVIKNDMIRDIASFFAQILPLIKSGTGSKPVA